MAPQALIPRQFVNDNNNNICVDQNGNQYYCRSGWYDWGRWVLLGAIIVASILFFFLFRRVPPQITGSSTSANFSTSCLSARRRKRMGARPMYGTGWATAPFGHGPATYNPNYQQQAPQQNVLPTYQQGGYYGANQGYFGGQQTGTELREPENAYRGGDTVYTPPTGPPPKKDGDGIIR